MESFLKKIESFSDSPFLVKDGILFSCNQLIAQINAYHGTIQQGIPQGMVVGAHIDYSFYSIALLFALGLNRNIIVPLSEEAAPKHGDYLDVAGVACEVRMDGNARLNITLSSIKETNVLYEKIREERHGGIVLFSSGSSGVPKGIVHDFNRLLTPYDQGGKSLKTLIFLKMDHIGGLNTLFYNLANNGFIIVPDSTSPAEVCRAIETYGADLLPTSPTFLNLMLLSGAVSRYDLSSLKLITYGTEPMPESTLLRIKKTLPHVKLKQTYGMSEIGILKTRSRADDSLWLKLGGKGVDIKIRDSILWIKSPVAMLGYLNAEDPFEDDGYINTGDRVEQDKEWLKILGRESEVINVGGYKVFPTEVESVLHQMSEVADAVVFGTPNPLTGHAVNAVIKIRSEVPLSEFKVAMRKFCRKHLRESYKIPVKISLTHEDLHSERFKKKRNVSNALID